VIVTGDVVRALILARLHHWEGAYVNGTWQQVIDNIIADFQQIKQIGDELYPNHSTLK
jgi:hypothetical protein